MEKVGRVLQVILKKHVNDHVLFWLKALPSVRLAHMNRIHSAIGVSPSEMLMGLRANLPLPLGDSINVASVSEPSPAKASEDITELRIYLLSWRRVPRITLRHSFIQMP